MGLDPPDKVVRTRAGPQRAATDARIQKLLDAAILAADTVRSQAREAAEGEAERIRSQAREAAEGEAERIRNDALASARVNAQQQAQVEIEEVLIAARAEADAARSRAASVLAIASGTVSTLRELLKDLIAAMEQAHDLLAEPGEALGDQLAQPPAEKSASPSDPNSDYRAPDDVGGGEVSALSTDDSASVDRTTEPTADTELHMNEDAEVGSNSGSDSELASEPDSVVEAATELGSSRPAAANGGGGAPASGDVDQARDGRLHPRRPLGSLFRTPKT